MRCAVALSTAVLAASAAAGPSVTRVRADAPVGMVEVRGVRAGAFNPAYWEKGTLHWVPDGRRPFLEPQQGPWRNIYAPSIVRDKDGWRVYYGGWDGSLTGNDRLYTTTFDGGFLKEGARRTIVENGAFVHVNNPSAWRDANGHVTLLATCYPAPGDRNKTGLFTSKDGVRFNSPATEKDLIRMEGYPDWPDADVNGMNVLLRDGIDWRLYFNDFKRWGKLNRASSRDGLNWKWDAVAVEEPMMINDLKPLALTGGQKAYAALFHANGDRLAYSISRDTAKLPPVRTLFTNLDAEERYIVSAGWVSDGKAVTGVLYGAGAVPSLDRNRIFARWLQKKVRFVTDEGDIAATGSAFGPDRFRFKLPGGKARGRLEVYELDGVKLLWRSAPMDLRGGETWKFVPVSR